MIQHDAGTGGQRGSDHDRHSETKRLIATMRRSEAITDGQFESLGMLITDASLCADEPTLTEIQDGLQRIYLRYLDAADLSCDQREQRGRIHGLIDVVHWALRRLPSGLQLNLVPDSYAARLLITVALRPGLSNKELAEELGTDETEVSRVGRRLLAAGVVWRRKEWRRNAWEITPRGQGYLDSSGLLPEPEEPDEPEPAIRVSVQPGKLSGVAVADSKAIVLARRSHELAPQSTPDATVGGVALIVGQLLEKLPDNIDRDDINLKVGFEGQLSDGRVVSAPDFAYDEGWANYPLQEQLEAVTRLNTTVASEDKPPA